ncbi:MAG: primary-amine oxidase [Gammaproteobacteria bacterium]|nr:primary-amine oxidase [Gammaproteobacteria bacterium]MDH3448156.1 primary-amine oxidase [Gammaproteobacteria bacterium]
MNPLQAPLNEAEIRQAASVVRRDAGLDESAWFETISLDESGFFPDQRCAYVCCYEPVSNRTLAGVVRFASDSLHRWRHIEGVQARIVPDEFAMACELARNDDAFLQALKKRGIDDASKVLVESWSAGNFGNPEEQGSRIAYGHCWLMNDAGDNPYARPIANLHPVFDLAARSIIRIDDFGVVPLPPDPGPIRRQARRDDLSEIAITQPQGPSFEVDGYRVNWHDWELQVGFAQRDGLVLYDIGIHDHGRLRPIMKRASLAEMVVPYGDPRGANFRRNAFDTGEYGIGVALDSLALGCDCLGHIHYFDVWTHDWCGEPRLIRNAVCMHEEDFGIQWKYSVPAARQTTVTRSRRLVVSSIATIGNYVYGFFWYFYLDGSIGVEVKATGIPFPSALENGKPSPYGRTIGDQIESHVHQHVFGFRFDMAVDGEHNSVSEVNFSAAPPGEDNRHGNAIMTEEARFRTELEAQREIDARSSRYWRVLNPGVRNRYGDPVAYKLLPGANSFPFQHPDSSMGRRAAFMYKHLWVTPFAADELYPAGWFPNQHAGGDGLPRWTQADRPIDDEHIVVWHTLNYHHWPRPEDWPVQPVVYAGFHWMPDGFFDENPTMDLPRR